MQKLRHDSKRLRTTQQTRKTRSKTSGLYSHSTNFATQPFEKLAEQTKTKQNCTNNRKRRSQTQQHDDSVKTSEQ